MIGLLATLTKLPFGAMTLVKEASRHILRHPVVGIAIVGRSDDGRLLLVRRADTLTWTLCGGTLEWGETLRQAAERELREEAGVLEAEFVRVASVVSDPARDPRFHAVTIVAEYRVAEPARRPENPLEILDARLFDPSDVPAELAMGFRDVLDRALASDACHLE